MRVGRVWGHSLLLGYSGGQGAGFRRAGRPQFRPRPRRLQPTPGIALPTGNTASAIPGHAPIPDVVAAVNGHSITRDELAAECRIHYGKEVLESMVNK